MAQAPSTSTAATHADIVDLKAVMVTRFTAVDTNAAANVAAITTKLDAASTAHTTALASLRTELLAAIAAIPAGTGTGGTGGTTPPSTDYFPADPALAPFPSPENSQQVILSGKVSGRPYLKDTLGRIHTLTITSTGASDYSVNGISLAPGWSGHADSPPTQLLVRQGGVYVFLASGATQFVNASGGIYNTALPPAFDAGTQLPPLPPLPTPSAIAPGSSGRVVLAGPTRALKTLSEAIPTALAGDKIQLDPGQYTDTPPFWNVPLLIDLGGATFDATGKTASLAMGKGLFVPNADSVLQNGTITNVAMDQTEGQLTSAIRPNDGCHYLTIKNIVAHDNQCGVGHGGFPLVLVVEDSDISDNGLVNNAGANTHNLYVGEACVRMTLTNVKSMGCKDAHAIKYRGHELISNGGTFGAATGSCFDLPNGTTTKFAINNAALIKPAGSPDHKVMCYGEEGATNGLAGGTINGGSIQADCDNPFILGQGGTITASGVAFTGNKVTGQGVTLVGF